MMRLRLRDRLGRKSARRFRIRPVFAGALRREADSLLVPGLPDWEAAGRRAADALPEGVADLVVEGTALAPADAVALATGLAMRLPLTARLDLWHEEAAALVPLWDRAWAVLQGAAFARGLVEAPANLLTPRDFAQRLEGLERHGIAVQVLGRRRLAAAGFGGLLAVGQGSANPPRLVVLRWAGRIAAPPVVFVGKGVTFDTGGLSLKPAAGMAAMRADMAGAAACAGAMLALALRDSPAPAAAVLPLAENAIGAAAYRPGDVLTLLSGRTVEVVDTDAEGRLILADALHYAVRAFRPAAVVDVATLTGAAITALGHHRAALFGTDAPLLAAVAAAGEAVGEPVWPLPIAASHRADLASAIADLRQCASGRGQPDACHAAAFLREALGEAPPPWAHLDMAGLATRPEGEGEGRPGATGFGVRLLDRLVASRFEEAHRA
ncbi:leucyl aminopeptidase family protein [Roseomonas sp. GC11]|uniref:leucyl aminopeptidase family protein n=1 Tax=Roseomonas sp. GC11 TaxID=2950546 RepID=UPI00210B1EE0|nr:leucyl aminopeptidase family protein [Roseomonas sp. GC11]MCQ4162333.1 leucyl aminopeptidase family protein [Roseomonas sp. GC11]